MKVRLKIMSRFKIIVFFVIGIAFIIGLFVWQYTSSLHTVKFSVTTGLSVKIYKVVNGVNQQPEVSTINSSTSLQFQNSNFCAVPGDTKYDETPVCFTVDNKDSSVVIEPNYSTDYLAQQLPAQLDKINSVINEKYSGIIDRFTLQTGQLFGRGEWYGTTLTQRVASQSDQGDVYRMLLKNNSGTWTVVAYPQIVLSKYTYPDVPHSVLDEVNGLPGSQA
jgi:hypothetical protein